MTQDRADAQLRRDLIGAHRECYRWIGILGGIKWRSVNLRMFVRDLIPRWEVDAGKSSLIWAF
jgi:hypothetical protein